MGELTNIIRMTRQITTKYLSQFWRMNISFLLFYCEIWQTWFLFVVPLFKKAISHQNHEDWLTSNFVQTVREPLQMSFRATGFRLIVKNFNDICDKVSHVKVARISFKKKNRLRTEDVCCVDGARPRHRLDRF